MTNYSMGRIVYLFATLTLLGLCRTANGQNDPLLSQYMFNPLYYNPAAAGSEGVSRFQLMHRTQWAGYQATNADDGGGPSTQLFSYTMPLEKFKSGMGLLVMNDKYGPAINQAVQLSYAYRMTLKSGTLALGVQGGLYNRGFDFAQFRPNEPDPLLQGGRITQAKPDIGVGVYYNTVDYWVGVSALHLNEPAFRLAGTQSVVPQTRITYLTAGYRLGISYDIDVQPSILVGYLPGSGRTTIATNLMATYQNKLWAGFGYRVGDVITANIGTSFMHNNSLRVGIAYDYTLSQRRASITGQSSYEIMASYALPALDTRKKPIVRTPRFRY
jgi:type IX secretion system PorP/SprF family membrane protein